MEALSLEISWHDGHGEHLTEIVSENSVLFDCFSLQNWQEVHDMSKAVATHKNFYGQETGFEFKNENGEAMVEVYSNNGSILVREYFFISKSLYLFELLIAGANEHHHTIRYESWWHAFTNYMLEIQEQIAP